MIKLLSRIAMMAALLASLHSCSSNDRYEIYYGLPEKKWDRFNFLRFEIPVDESKTGKNMDIVMVATVSNNFSFETLDFNVTMRGPDGDERIREYQMKVRDKNGTLLEPLNGDTCQVKMNLRKQYRFKKPGVLNIEIENLVPRMYAEGVVGIKILLVPSEAK